jgi:hypothetical protein
MDRVRDIVPARPACPGGFGRGDFSGVVVNLDFLKYKSNRNNPTGQVTWHLREQNHHLIVRSRENSNNHPIFKELIYGL